MKSLTLTAFFVFNITFSFAGSLGTNGPNKFSISLLNKVLVEVLVKDRFSPPVASRIHAYCNLAFYEILFHNDTAHRSVKYFKNFPVPSPASINNKINVDLAAYSAFIHVARKLTFSVKEWDDAVERFHSNPIDSIEFANASVWFSGWLLKYMEWIKLDGFPERLTFEKYTISNRPDLYQLTPPAYKAPLEPYWGKQRTFYIPEGSPGAENVLVFDTANTSVFYKMNLELYEKSKKISEEEKDIALHWDDNPIQIKSLGHIMLYNFRMTPASHWIVIACDILELQKSDIKNSATVLTVLSLAMADAFIVCWNDKYKYNTIRPVSYINKYINDSWQSYIETPTFPEFPSGHSLISATAAEILTLFLGENFEFTDNSQLAYGQKARTYNSFYMAAEEAGISRYYGGIHYLPSINKGYDAGIKIGEQICKIIQIFKK